MTRPLHVSGAFGERFVVERELGRGGMSTVYLAHDRKHDRKVAVKLLHGDAGAMLGAERFAHEIRVTAQLQHPHILPLLDSDQAEGHTFYVMPYVEGESLRERMTREGRLPVAETLQIAREVADALAYAHGRDVVHRDIKPENILLSGGHAVVADFGIARALSAAVAEDLRLTQAGLSIGTPAYMSPEQAMGEDVVDGRTDLYALGCVLYEMLAGQLPFAGKSPMAVLANKMSGIFAAVGTLRDDIPPGVDALLARLLAREAAERMPRAPDAVQAIDALLRGRGYAAPPSESSANTVAVLAFLSMSPDANDEYLADGISEELMHALTRIPGLRVIARTSAFAFKRSGLDVREIGQRLRVRRVVEGSVRRSGDRLRVTAKLIDADSALEIWSERFDRRVDDLFAVEDELSESIAGRLRELLQDEGGEPIPTELVKSTPRTTTLSAYEEYLKGRYWWAMRTERAMRLSIDHLEAALHLDPQFAPAYGALAETLATMGLYGMAAPQEVMPLALDAAECALAIDPSSAEALCARGCVRAVFEWHWDAAARDFELAIAANAQYPTAHQWYANSVLVPMGRFDEAHAALARARELDPLSPSIAISMAAAYYYERRASDAIACCREVLRLDDRFAMGYFFLGLALELAGEPEDAAAALARAAELSGSAEAIAACGHLHAARGDSSAAHKAREALDRRARDEYQSPVLAAQIATRLGETDTAITALHQAHTLRSADLIWIGVRPAFEPLHTHDDFVHLLDEIGLALPARTTGTFTPAPSSGSGVA